MPEEVSREVVVNWIIGTSWLNSSSSKREELESTQPYCIAERFLEFNVTLHMLKESGCFTSQKLCTSAVK